MADPQVIAVIPARYQSQRFPGKPLAKIAGKMMINRVARAASEAVTVDRVIVATDDQRVFDAVDRALATPLMTSSEHSSGSDRVAEVAVSFPTAKIILNVQGDEPLIKAADLDAGVEILQSRPDLNLVSFAAPCPAGEETDPDLVKVVKTLSGKALYFSRSPIPFARAKEPDYWQHIGIYIYRRSALLDFVRNSPTPLELTEQLEQLRLLQNGVDIQLVELKEPTVGVDRPADIRLVEERIKHS